MKHVMLSPSIIGDWFNDFFNNRQKKEEVSHERNILKIFSGIFNRSEQQCAFLYNLVGRDYDKYVELEIQIKNQHLFSVPATEKEFEEVMNRSTEGWFDKIFDKRCQEIGERR